MARFIADLPPGDLLIGTSPDAAFALALDRFGLCSMTLSLEILVFYQDPCETSLTTPR